MKIIHVVGSFYPDAVGGAELYGYHLALGLNKLGLVNVLAVPGNKTEISSYKDMRIYRFFSPVKGNDTLRELYGGGSREAAISFADILDKVNPQLVHIHTVSREISLHLVQETRKRGVKIIFTNQSPSVTCARETLMRWSHEICDGVMHNPICAQCMLHHLGLNKPAAKFFGGLPIPLSARLGKIIRKGKLATVLRMPELIHMKEQSFHAIVNNVDHVVVVAQWTKTLMLKNGVPENKVSVIRTGINVSSQKLPHDIIHSIVKPRARFRLVCLGRAAPTKGFDFLIEVIKENPELDMTLDIFLAYINKHELKHKRYLGSIARNDHRISLRDAVNNDMIIELLKNYDMLVIPSQWFENAPLVILEAFAAGIPVIGSDLGGISEMIMSEHNGILVSPFNSKLAWSKALTRLNEDSGLLSALRSHIVPPKSNKELAQDMLAIYSQILRTPKMKGDIL